MLTAWPVCYMESQSHNVSLLRKKIYWPLSEPNQAIGVIVLILLDQRKNIKHSIHIFHVNTRQAYLKHLGPQRKINVKQT